MISQSNFKLNILIDPVHTKHAGRSDRLIHVRRVTFLIVLICFYPNADANIIDLRPKLKQFTLGPYKRVWQKDKEKKTLKMLNRKIIATKL